MKLAIRARRLATGMLAFSGILALAAWSLGPLQSGSSDANVAFGAPARSGTASISAEVKYTDSTGRPQKKTLTGSTDVTNATTPTEKRDALQSKLQTEIDNNKVGGEPLLELGGTASGSSMTITPKSTAAASEVKVKAVASNDKKTGENDRISNFSTSGTGIAEIVVNGDITGLADAGSTPIFFVETNLGEVSVTLTGSMEKIDLLWQLQAGLLAHGAPAIVDQRRSALLVVLEDETIQWIAAGSTDNGLTAVCKVMAP